MLPLCPVDIPALFFVCYFMFILVANKFDLIDLNWKYSKILCYLLFKAHQNTIPTAMFMLSGLILSMAVIFTLPAVEINKYCG